MNEEYENLLNAVEIFLQKADNDLENQLREERFANPKETVKHISDLEEQIAEALREQSEDAEELIYNAQKNGEDISQVIEKLPELFENDKIKEKLNKIFIGMFSQYIPQLANVYITQMDSELIAEEISMKTTAWISDWSEELSELMELSSHEEIEGVLTRGLKNGHGIDKITRDIMENGIRNEYYKAHRAALTETLRAHSVASEEAIQQCPAAEYKEWVHTGAHKNKPRDNHVSISGQIVPKNEPFKLVGRDGGIYFPMFPLDTSLPASESVNCHCIHRGIASKEILGLSIEERRRLQKEAVERMNEDFINSLDEKNKAKAGINPKTVKCDWLRNKKTVTERKKYFKSDSRWALFESGVIKTDADLEKLYTYDKNAENNSLKRRFKTLTELKNDGIITVSKDRLEHSSFGDWTKTNRLEKGGHGQRGMEKLLSTGVEPIIYKEYSNGVRIGSVPNHKSPTKNINSKRANCDIGQSWFPKNWDDDKIMAAGTYAANCGNGDDVMKKAVFDGVEVVVYINDGQVGTICPNNVRQPKGDEWENARN